MTDIEFDVGDDGVGRCRRDETGTTVRCWCPAYVDFVPWDTAGPVDEEVLEHVGCQGHVSIR